MRIVMLNAEIPPVKSGVAHQVTRLSQVLSQRGHDVVIRTLSPPPSATSYRVEKVKGPAFMRSNPWKLAATPVAFACGRYGEADVIHAHGDNPILWRRAVPVVRTFYGTAREEARHAKRMRRKASQSLLICSEFMGKALSTVSVGISENTARSLGGLDLIIPCGVDRNLFHPGPKSKNPSILYVGTLSGRKRGKLVVDLFTRVVKAKLPSAELWLVTDEYINGDGITCFGLVPDEVLARLFREAWILTLPSTYEGFGVPYIEAMASGTPVVATHNAGAGELVRAETGGVVVADERLGEEVCLLLQDSEWRSILGSLGREASKRFDWKTVATSYEEAYALAVQRRTSEPNPGLS